MRTVLDALKHCVYATVYNSVHTVEECLKSVFSPSYEVVVVDACSTDGTYEKLASLKKDFNITLLRYRCSRGLGRNIALSHCPNGCFTAYFDMDAVYNRNFHVAMEAELDPSFTGAVGQHTIYAKKETILRVGGWRDLMSSEREELLARVRPKTCIPAKIGSNWAPPAHIRSREARYERGLTLVWRLVRVNVDTIRGRGLLPYELRGRGLILYPLARLQGVYRHDPEHNNLFLEYAERFRRAIDPTPLGVHVDDVMLSGSEEVARKLGADDLIRGAWGSAYKFREGERILYTKSVEAVRKHFGEKRFAFVGRV